VQEFFNNFVTTYSIRIREHLNHYEFSNALFSMLCGWTATTGE